MFCIIFQIYGYLCDKESVFYYLYLMYKSKNKLLNIRRKCSLYFLAYQFILLLSVSYFICLLQLNAYSIGSVLPKPNPKSSLVDFETSSYKQCSGMQIQKQVLPGSCVYVHEVVMSRNLLNGLHLPHYQKWIIPELSCFNYLCKVFLYPVVRFCYFAKYKLRINGFP